VPPRKPTIGDLAALEKLLVSARSKRTLAQWVKKLPNGRRGRPKADDELWLAGFELLCRTAEREDGHNRAGVSRFALLKTLAPAFGLSGKSPEAIARRLTKMLRKRNFSDQELYDLLKVTDPSKVRFFEDEP
jgi:hypothetical protein